MTDWIVAGLFVAGWLFIGLVLVLYRTSTVPQRREELEGILDERAAEVYLGLFSPNQLAADEPREEVLQIFEGLHDVRSYVSGSVALLLTSGGTLWLGHAWVRGRLHPGEGTFDVSLTIILAMAGAYVWCVTELLDRKSSGDMTPNEIYRIALRFLYAAPVGYAFSLLAGAAEAAGLLAFAASAFPVKQTRRLFQTYVLRTTGADQGTGAPTREARIGQVIHGMSRETVTRLADVHIYTCVDLAYADPIRLMATTGLPLRCLVDWMDQAILALNVDMSRHDLARLGLRGALEVYHLYEAECLDDDLEIRSDAEDQPRIIELAEILESSPGFVVWLLGEVGQDPHVDFLSRVWGEEEVDEEEAEEEQA